MAKAVAIQEAARKSLARLLRPLSALAFDCGLSMSEVNMILRTAAVQSAAARQLENSNRVNISGISALTGIPRGEVSRILNSGGGVVVGVIQGRQNITSRILSAWHCDPRYLTANHRARKLKIFGSGLTFESLVRAHGRGIPIRAILDELRRSGSIHFLTSSKEIFPKMPLAINPRITHKIIRALHAATDNVLRCLSSPSGVSFDKVCGAKVCSEHVPRVGRKFGSSCIAQVPEQTKMAQGKAKHRHKDGRKVTHLSMTIGYGKADDQIAQHSPKNRRNLHRSR